MIPTLKTEEQPSHLKGKEPIEHVAEAKAKGLLSTTEVHGTELPGHISSGADAARETAVILLILWLVLAHTPLSQLAILKILGLFVLGWIVWKAGRSAWLAWSRLERMHRVVEQERWEIQHHRQQEKDELKELYRSKGFEGRLLDDVIDVLMADEDRLLRVMVEEELCLSLGTHEHPLKQALGAAVGTLCATCICFLFYYSFPGFGLWIGSFLTIGGATGIAAKFEDNRIIPAIVWNLGLAALTISSTFFLFEYIY